MTTAAAVTPKVELVHTDRLRPNPDNPRTVIDGIDELAESIGSIGIQQPLTVIPAGEEFMIAAGHRRHAAAVQAGLELVPVIIRRDLDPADEDSLLVFGLVENLARKGLDPIDEAEAYAKLVAKGWTHTEISTRVGVSGFTVSQRLRLLKLSASERRLLREGVFTIGEAYDLVKTASPPRPRRIETNKIRRLERNVVQLKSTVEFLEGCSDLDGADQLELASGHITFALGLIAGTLPEAIDDSLPRGEMRGRLTLSCCGKPALDHPAIGVCPQ